MILVEVVTTIIIVEYCTHCGGCAMPLLHSHLTFTLVPATTAGDYVAVRAVMRTPIAGCHPCCCDTTCQLVAGKHCRAITCHTIASATAHPTPTGPLPCATLLPRLCLFHWSHPQPGPQLIPRWIVWCGGCSPTHTPHPTPQSLSGIDMVVVEPQWWCAG